MNAMGRGCNGKKRVLVAGMLLALMGSVAQLPSVPCTVAEMVSLPTLEIGVKLTPEQLVTPDEVTLTFTIANHSNFVAENVSLAGPDGTVTPIGEIAAGAVQDFTCTHWVTQAELNAGIISYLITCETDVGQISYPANAAIEKNIAQPEVTLSREISSDCVVGGSAVTVVYTLKNTGNVPVHALEFIDPLGSYTAHLDALEVGQSKLLMNRTVLMEEAISSPVLTYASGEERENSYTVRLDERTIRVVHSEMQVEFSAAQSLFASDSAQATLRLLNTGNADYRNIIIYDDFYGGIIADSVELPAGSEMLEISASYPLRAAGAYRWRITGVNEAGEQVEIVTDTATVTEWEPYGEVLLKLKALTNMPRINREGIVEFVLELTNIGDTFATNVHLSEATRGEICDLVVVPTGASTVYKVKYEVESDASFVFSASYIDLAGQTRTALSNPVEVVITAGGDTPELPKEGHLAYSGFTIALGGSAMFVGLLIGSCIVLLVLSIMLFVASHKARRERKERIAARKQRIKEEMAKTNAFTPVKRNKKKQ